MNDNSKFIKIAFIHNIVAPYRVQLFNKLNVNSNYKINFFFCARTHNNRNWDIPELNVNHDFLKGFTISLGEYNIHFNDVRKIFKNNYDIVIVGGNYDFTTVASILYCKIANIPTILYTESIEKQQKGIKKYIFTALDSYIAHLVTTIVVTGKRSFKYYQNFNLDKNIFTAVDAVECIKLHNEEPGNIKPTNYDKIIFITIAQLIDRKGIRILLAAVQILEKVYPNFILYIVGEGPLRAVYEDICNQYELKNVIFTGWVDDQKKNELLSQSDIFVLPTLADVWGLVVNEAMGFGLAIITTKSAGCSDDLVVDGVNGFTVESNNPIQLADKMLEAISSKNIDNMKIKSIEILSHYSIDNSVKGFEKAIDSIIDSRGEV